jgi:hypothetical protein
VRRFQYCLYLRMMVRGRDDRSSCTVRDETWSHENNELLTERGERVAAVAAEGYRAKCLTAHGHNVPWLGSYLYSQFQGRIHCSLVTLSGNCVATARSASSHSNLLNLHALEVTPRSGRAVCAGACTFCCAGPLNPKWSYV